MGGQHFRRFEMSKHVLNNPQTTILAFIGDQVMHSFDKNSPLWDDTSCAAVLKLGAWLFIKPILQLDVKCTSSVITFSLF